MSSQPRDRAFPRGPLIGAAALVLVALGVAGVGSLGGMGGSSVPVEATPLRVRELVFVDRADGSILVRDAGTDRDITVLDPGTNAFVRGTLRALVRDRRREEVGGQSPFRLAAWPDGRLTLQDPATGNSVGLEAFGPTNMEAFAKLLTAEGGTQR